MTLEEQMHIIISVLEGIHIELISIRERLEGDS